MERERERERESGQGRRKQFERVVVEIVDLPNLFSLLSSNNAHTDITTLKSLPIKPLKSPKSPTMAGKRRHRTKSAKSPNIAPIKKGKQSFAVSQFRLQQREMILSSLVMLSSRNVVVSLSLETASWKGRWKEGLFPLELVREQLASPSRAVS